MVLDVTCKSNNSLRDSVRVTTHNAPQVDRLENHSKPGQIIQCQSVWRGTDSPGTVHRSNRLPWCRKYAVMGKFGVITKPFNTPPFPRNGESDKASR